MKRFAHLNNPGNSRGFTITLARTGQSIFVPAGRSILSVLLEAGIEVAYNCGDGKCGVCEVGVVAGIPDHRDYVPYGQRADDALMVCCSGSLTDELVLDL